MLSKVNSDALIFVKRFYLAEFRQMFRFRELKLNFSTAQDVFRPGDQIPCKVILNIDGQMETKGIEVISKGKLNFVLFACHLIRYMHYSESL